VVDHHEYLIMEVFFPELNKTSVIAKDQPVSFAFHPDLKDLREDFDKWFIHWKEKRSDYATIFKKYRQLLEVNRKKMRYEKPELILGKISKYDKLVQDHSKLNEFDWLLISALIYQESRFRPDAESPVGARGLMQLMPSVATTYKVNFQNLNDPRKNVALGTRYLRYLYNYYDKDSTLTRDNKIKFTLASYNAGLGHIIDARALAKKHNMDPNVWDGNVAEMLTKKHLGEFNRDPVVRYGHFRGWETYGYVKNIMMYYDHYQDHMEKYFSTETE
jgi:membrane-bound lytic murein transglycosylase F